MNENPEDEKALDLSALDFGPAWARPTDAKHSNKKVGRDTAQRDNRSNEVRHDKRRRRSDGFERRRNGGRSGPNHRKSQRPIEVAVVDGVSAEIMPIEEGVDNLSKEISAVGRTYSVFDLARMILESADRYIIIFRKEGSDSGLFQSKKDGAVFLTKGECITHFCSSENFKEYYVAEDIEVEPPKGKFQSIAKCGFSGKLLGPSNYHGYNQNIVNQHQAEFSNMALDKYKSRIVIESGEEVVNAWLDAMKKKTQYRLVSDKDILFEDKKKMHSHFVSEYFEEIFHVTHRADVHSQVAKHLLSPELYNLMRETVKDQRRYPGKLAPFLCRQLSGRRLAVFKWQGKLHCGPSRPHTIGVDVQLAERPAIMLAWILGNPGGGIDALWKEVLPENISDEAKKEWFHDLHWMINQGFVILVNDGRIYSSDHTAPTKKKNANPMGKKKS